MIVTTTESVQGKVVDRYLGIVSGMDTYLIGGILGEGLVSSAGNAYSKGTIEKAQQRMVDDARALGADAIIGLQISTASPAGASGHMYIQMVGTAVTLKDDEEEDWLPEL